MQKVSFYMLPSDAYLNLNIEDLINLQNTIDKIKQSESDSWFIPNDFYTICDTQGVEAVDYLYSDISNDSSSYFLEIIKESSNTCDRKYNEIIKNESKDYYGCIALGEKKYPNLNLDDIIPKQLIVIKDIEIQKVKRYYLRECKDYNEFSKNVEACFEDLIFHQDCYAPINKLGRINENLQEIIRHLEALNDFGKEIYFKENKNESQVFKILQSTHKIICSGKGSNETKDYKKEYIKKDEDGAKTKYELTCNPHTKLFQKNNDKRIYFCWGRDEIENHKIIIVRMGDHWG